MLIQSINNQHLNASKTYLSADATTGTQLLVKNVNNVNASWALQIGETGQERTEIVMVSGTPTAGTVNLAATTRFAHPVDTPVYCYKYDQVVFERSTAGTAGTASPMTNGTVTITPDRFDLYGNSYTVFDDTTADSSYTYKVKFYNSVLASESSESDWIYPTGYSFYSLYRLRERAKAKMINSPADSKVDDWINEWHEVMTNTLVATNKDYAIGTLELSYAAGQQYGTITANDFKFPRRVWFIDGRGTTEVNPLNINDVKPLTDPTYVYAYYFRGNDVIGRTPTTLPGTMKIEYYTFASYLSNDGDELPLPMRGYTRAYVEYARAQAAYLDRDKELGQSLEENCEVYRSQFKAEVSPRQKSGYDYVKRTVPYDTEF